MKNYIFNLDKTLKRIDKFVDRKNLSYHEKEYLNYKLIVLSQLNYLTSFQISKKTNNKLIKKFKKKISTNIFCLNFEKDKISIKKFFFIANIIKVNLRYFKSILLIFFNLFKTENTKFTLFFGDLFKNSNINLTDVNNFFLKKKKLFDIKNEKVIFNYRLSNIKSNKYYFKKDALLFVSIYSLNFLDKLKLVSQLFLNIIILNFKLLKDKHLIFISQEYLDLDLINFLKNKNIIKKIFFFHTSAINSLPLWTFYNGFEDKKIYILDSVSNLYPLNFIKKKTNSVNSILPQFKYLNFQEIYTCDEKIKKIYKNKSKVNYTKINPFSYNIKAIRKKINTKYNICIFDSSILKVPSYLNDKEYQIKGYYSHLSLTKFITSILKVVQKINNQKKIKINCYIKRKPDFGRNASHKNSIIELQKKFSFFKFLNPQIYIENYYSCFDTVISYPNTSQSIFYSKVTGKEALFYDVENLLQNKYDNNITLINTEYNLEKKLIKIFKLND